MPILLILTLTAACLPVDWPAPLLGGGLEVPAIFTLTAVALALSVAFGLRSWVVRTLRHSPERKIEVAQTYSRLRRRLFFTNIGMVASCVLVFGWGWLTQQLLVVGGDNKPCLAPFAELAVPLPYFAILFGAWIIYYDAERALHRTTILGPSTREFWSRFGYFSNHFRQFALMVLLPVFLFVTQQTATRFCPETAGSDAYKIASVAVAPVFILVMPLIIKPLLGLRSLPAGPARGRLESLAKRLHFHYADFLFWPTHGATANAMIVGLVPRVRYVIFTDRILDELLPDEVDAVFGHEVGHAKHGHIWLYALFLSLSITTLAAAFLLLGQQLDAAGVELPKWAEAWIALPPLLLAGSYIFLVFGYLSRKCERQADVYGCRSVSCANPHCTGHDGDTLYPERGHGLCPTGIRTFISALQRVDFVNGTLGYDEEQARTLGGVIKSFFKWLKSWQHSTMSRRIAFLRSLIENPQLEQNFQWRVTALRWGMILGLAATLFGLGEAVGWKELFQSM
jgi:Zn-dependent protease with chaperone function